MATKSPSFNMYPNNWLGSSRIAAMLPEQEGPYLRLLLYQWQSEDQTIPADDIELATMSRLMDRWERLGPGIKRCFDEVPEIPGRLRNERLFCEYERIMSARERKSYGGRKRAAVLWGTKSKEEPAEVVAKQCESNQENGSLAIAEQGNQLKDSCSWEQGTGNREQGTNKIKRKKVNPFKSWTKQDLFNDVEANNADKLLNPDQLMRFVNYWFQEDEYGKPKIAGCDTWSTRMRMCTALRMAFCHDNKTRSKALPNTWKGEDPTLNTF